MRTIINSKEIIKPVSDYTSGPPLETFLVLKLDSEGISITGTDNITDEGAWGLARLAANEIEELILNNSKKTKGVNDGCKE